MCTTEDSAVDDEPKPPPTASLHEKKLGWYGKVKKAAWRSLFGTIMMSLFGFIIYLGHAYVCIMVFTIQCCLFKELVGVRKKLSNERRIPLFRSIQWAWFFVAAFFTWSDGIYAYVRENPMRANKWSSGLRNFFLEKSKFISFSLYSGLFMVSILTLRKGLYKYQFTQYSWTLTSCCIIVFQMRAAFQMIYSGLFWFLLPCSLVICNDIMAYFSGVTLGGKLIRRPFLELSPNKTWEGFVGAAAWTLLFAFWFSRYLSDKTWAVCTPEDISFDVRPLSCTPAPMYKLHSLKALAEDSLPDSLWQVCLVVSHYAPRLSAVGSWEVRPSQVHALALGAFASVVAPFGGFLASAIKRAYGIKDFNNVIPGHGGMMDRFDCQFIMCMCTYVHHFTFCRQTPFSVEAILAAVSMLRVEERREVIARLNKQFGD